MVVPKNGCFISMGKSMTINGWWLGVPPWRNGNHHISNMFREIKNHQIPAVLMCFGGFTMSLVTHNRRSPFALASAAASILSTVAGWSPALRCSHAINAPRFWGRAWYVWDVKKQHKFGYLLCLLLSLNNFITTNHHELGIVGNNPAAMVISSMGMFLFWKNQTHFEFYNYWILWNWTLSLVNDLEFFTVTFLCTWDKQPISYGYPTFDGESSSSPRPHNWALR